MKRQTGEILTMAVMLGATGCSGGSGDTETAHLDPKPVVATQSTSTPAVDRASADFSIKYSIAQLDELAAAAMDTSYKAKSPEEH